MRLLALLLAVAFGACCSLPQPPLPNSANAESTVEPETPPVGAEALGVEWRSFHAPTGKILMAVARPGGKGPFPALVIFHGTHGFAREYVQIAKELSQSGVIAVAACWFAPGQGKGLRDISPLPCPTAAPGISPHQSRESGRTIDAIVATVRQLPGVDPNHIAIFGHSRGGGAAWDYVLRGEAQALILNSTGYPDERISQVAQIAAPVLILHGENDTFGPMTQVRRARLFEGAMRQAGKPVEAVYYRGGEHNSLFANSSQHADEVKRIKTFMRRYLGRN